MVDSESTTTISNLDASVRSPHDRTIAPVPPEANNSVFDIDSEVFTSNMDRIITNRNTLFNWVDKTFVENVDYMYVSFGGRTSDKPSLLKGGAEKVCSALNLVARFPNLSEYEKLAMSSAELKAMVLRCELYHNGSLVGEGAGGRSIQQDRGDLNKYLKMCIKSAFLDATIRTLGMSAMFTQDGDELEEDKAEEQEPLLSSDQKTEILLLASKLDESKQFTTEKWLEKNRTLKDGDNMIARLKEFVTKEEKAVAKKDKPKSKKPKVLREDHKYLMDTASGCWMMSQAEVESILNKKIRELEYGDIVADLTKKQVESFVKNITDGKMTP
tara:strand:+ start:3034 stop:4017 length:984 start_codon:yes stop_codon:yes gene_type:complete